MVTSIKIVRLHTMSGHVKSMIWQKCLKNPTQLFINCIFAEYVQQVIRQLQEEKAILFFFSYLHSLLSLSSSQFHSYLIAKQIHNIYRSFVNYEWKEKYREKYFFDESPKLHSSRFFSVSKALYVPCFTLVLYLY